MAALPARVYSSSAAYKSHAWSALAKRVTLEVTISLLPLLPLHVLHEAAGSQARQALLVSRSNSGHWHWQWC